MRIAVARTSHRLLENRTHQLILLLELVNLLFVFQQLRLRVLLDLQINAQHPTFKSTHQTRIHVGIKHLAEVQLLG